MKILIVDNHTKNLKEMLALLRDYDNSVCTRELFSSGLADTFDLIIFSGGSGVRSVKNHKDDYKNEIEYIKSSNKKIIGICLGCEVVASAFDCKLQENNDIHKGVYSIKYNGKNLNVYEAHKFQISEVSDDIEILAASDYGIEIIKHKTKPIYGLQFHPEMIVDNNKDNILLEIIKEM